MDQYQNLKENVYYVYMHVHPRTGEIVYVGHGYSGRAWAFGSYRRDTSDVSRDEQHKQWAIELQNEGYIPEEFVKIHTKNLTKKEAGTLEQEVIRITNPKYNKPLGRSLLKLTKEQLQAANDFRKEGMSYSEIAEEVGLSTMTVWRALNDKNKNREVK